MTRWLSVAFFLTMMPLAVAMEDTPENREQQVERYLQAAAPKAIYDDLTSKMFKHLPPDQRGIAGGGMSKSFDFEVLTKLMRAAMLKTFTADELAALADFYGSPVGKSAMSKMGDYMAELMAELGPILNAEMAQIAAEADKAQAERPKQPDDLNQPGK
jgi:hypothetical protein